MTCGGRCWGGGGNENLLKEEFLESYKDLLWKETTQERLHLSLKQSVEDSQLLVAAMEDTECLNALHDIARWHAYAIPFLLNTLFLDIPGCKEAYALLAKHRLLYKLLTSATNIPHTLATAYAISRFRENNLLPIARSVLKDELNLNNLNTNEQLLTVVCKLVTFRNPDVAVIRHVFDTLFRNTEDTAAFDLERYHRIFCER